MSWVGLCRDPYCSVKTFDSVIFEMQEIRASICAFIATEPVK